MNDLDRYAVSLENMEVLRAQVEAQVREIAMLRSYEAEWERLLNAKQSVGAPGEFNKGDTDPAGDDGNWAAGIHHLTFDGNVLTPTGVGTNTSRPKNDWFQRIVVYGTGPAQAEALRDRVLAALNSSPASAGDERAALRYTSDGELAECPCCGSLDVGGANGTVSCYSCDLQMTKPRPLQNAADAWNKRAALSANHSEQVRDGWKLVPVEPQGRQQFNAAFNLCSEFGEVFVRINKKFAMAVYREMLAAAPSAGSQKEQK